ncbi:zinc finger BED domain-containing protein 6-like [Rhagoletis pomonella]|uniref:zinc finger BED domain-containing protein 6-like n=1 Tax=Rhagoletis pomonella TaxID=28610 RepID=UPI001785AF41|nr:zinc finger BED domain-containing protein 6-like [Rhagoletis pomonella]
MNRRHQFQRISRQAQPIEEVLLDIEGSELNNNIREVNNNNSEVNNNNTRQLNNSTVTPQVPTQIRPRELNASQPQVTNFLYKPLPIKKQREIDQQVLKIVREYHPFSVVEDIEFKKLVFLLNSNYKLPSRKTISSSLIPATYNETVEIVKKRLERAYAICLTMDGWTSRAQDSFFSVTAHYVVEEEKRTFLASDLLACSAYAERHTGENITKKMIEIFNEWGIYNKITVVVTDNAANMKAAVRGGGWRHWGCFAHSLNLVAQAGLKEIEPVLCKVKSIVRFFSKSSHAIQNLKLR